VLFCELHGNSELHGERCIVEGRRDTIRCRMERNGKGRVLLSEHSVATEWGGEETPCVV